jgi:hypothetical protein
MVFCDKILSHGMLFSSVTHLEYFPMFHSFSLLVNIPLHRCVTLINPDISWWTFRLYIHLLIMKNDVMNMTLILLVLYS